MKKVFTHQLRTFISCGLFSLFGLSAFAQVGIGTTTPRGALDINSSTSGLVLPTVTLTASNVEAPVTNPQTGALAAGTMVFNNGTSTIPVFNAGNGVSPGIYYWDGSRWISQFHKKFFKTFTQTAELRVDTDPGEFKPIVGLNAQTFIAPYDGTYQVLFFGYLGAEQPLDYTTNLYFIDDISGYAAVGLVEGVFRLRINDGISNNNFRKYMHAESFYRSSDGANGSGGTTYYLLYNEVSIIATVSLTAGATCTISASYSPDASDNINSVGVFEHNVGETDLNLGNLCNVHVTYLGKD